MKKCNKVKLNEMIQGMDNHLIMYKWCTKDYCGNVNEYYLLGINKDRKPVYIRFIVIDNLYNDKRKYYSKKDYKLDIKVARYYNKKYMLYSAANNNTKWNCYSARCILYDTYYSDTLDNLKKEFIYLNLHSDFELSYFIKLCKYTFIDIPNNVLNGTISYNVANAMSLHNIDMLKKLLSHNDILFDTYNTTDIYNNATSQYNNVDDKFSDLD